MNTAEIDNTINTIANDSLKQLFVEMLKNMKEHFNDKVNIVRDNIIKYAISVKNTAEYILIDNLMYNMFIEYAKTWETYNRYF